MRSIFILLLPVLAAGSPTLFFPWLSGGDSGSSGKGRSGKGQLPLDPAEPPEPEPPAEIDPGWIDPRLGGGRFLDFTTPHFGEPLNVIISANSDPHILTTSGFHGYAKSIGFAEECFNVHIGTIHKADLGDGRGKQPEAYLARQFYFPGPSSSIGTCWESLVGGNHFRAWQQNTTGAWFLAASMEENSSKHHKIVPDGYNRGRDWLVDRAVQGSRWDGMWWVAEVEWRTGLLEPGSRGVNHWIRQDGMVAILTVHRMTRELEIYIPPSLLTVLVGSLMLTTVATGLYYLFTTYLLYPLTRTIRY